MDQEQNNINNTQKTSVPILATISFSKQEIRGQNKYSADDCRYVQREENDHLMLMIILGVEYLNQGCSPDLWLAHFLAGSTGANTCELAQPTLSGSSLSSAHAPLNLTQLGSDSVQAQLYPVQLI